MMKAGMTRFLLATFSMILVGCSSTLREDPVIPAVTANYPTLEFRACGQLWHGLGVCYLAEGEQHDSVNLRIQGYYAGTVRVFSEACDLDLLTRYSGSQLLRIDLPILESGKSCLITALMSPEYPDGAADDVIVYSFIGHLAIRAQKGEELWHGETRKLSGQWTSQFELQIGNFPKALVAVRGCEIDYTENMDLDQGFLRLDLSRAILRKQTGNCVAEGVALVRGEIDSTFSILTAQYATSLPNDPVWQNSNFVPLPIPTIEIEGGRVKVVGSPQVSVVSLNGEFEIDREAEFEFDRTKENILRLITVKGRTVIGYWPVGSQEFRWLQ